MEPNPQRTWWPIPVAIAVGMLLGKAGHRYPVLGAGLRSLGPPLVVLMLVGFWRRRRSRK